MLNELGMKMCKICGTECSWVFCSDCKKLIGNGMDEMKADLATANARIAELESEVAAGKALLDAVSSAETDNYSFTKVGEKEWIATNATTEQWVKVTFASLLEAFTALTGKEKQQ
jgi:hypothetical protein